MNNHATRECWFNGRNTGIEGKYNRWVTEERVKLDELNRNLTPAYVSTVTPRYALQA